MNKLFMKLLVGALAVGLDGCGADAQNNAVIAQGFIELHSDDHLDSGEFTNKRAEIITDQSTYETELANYSSDQPATVDFSTNTVVLVDMGRRDTGGYSIAVTAVEEHDNYVITRVALSVPGENCVVTEAVTNPYQFAQVETTKELLIQEELQIAPCDPT